ncbi:MAP kinase-activated protein kinase 2 [Galemys pyrenaicus]|uniref:MAP kinase-activated protein kinase 2 n=1 Tax=Galemys pyrenaicus TaxID=202257 RepID=A0A8J6DRH6_GALPY|nr:MAP kinase-activated protein kinase 2 [Galemys pyrenaicus]
MLPNAQGQASPVLLPSPPPPPQPPAPAPPPQPPPQFPQFHVKCGLQIKKNAIIDDYKVTTQVLGLGINGKVLQIFSKKTQEKFALKVGCGPGRERASSAGPGRAGRAGVRAGRARGGAGGAAGRSGPGGHAPAPSFRSPPAGAGGRGSESGGLCHFGV